MKILPAVLIALTTFYVSATRAEVGDTNVIDAVATKPGSARAILLLHQARPWNDESLALLQRKLAFYSEAIGSESLTKQKPEVKGKSIRIIVVCREDPTPTAEEVLNRFKSEMSQHDVSLVWGTQKQVVSLAEAP